MLAEARTTEVRTTIGLSMLGHVDTSSFLNASMISANHKKILADKCLCQLEGRQGVKKSFRGGGAGGGTGRECWMVDEEEDIPVTLVSQLLPRLDRTVLHVFRGETFDEKMTRFFRSLDIKSPLVS